MKKPEADFCIYIDFDKNTPEPSRIFKAMTELIDSFQEIDKTLVSLIDNKIDTVLLLEDIQAGSLKTWLKNVLTALDDEGIKNLNWKPLIGKYLVKAKYILLDMMNKRTTITDRKEIIQAQNDLLRLAEDTGVKRIPAYAPITPQKIIESLGKINGAIKNLSNKDKATYITNDDQEVRFNIEFNFVPEALEDLITKEVLEATIPMILKVKKPDYLGESKWEFKYENRIISAKIHDEEWLSKFQNREIDVRPGDSIRASVKQIAKYGYDFSVISISYEILKVVEIIRVEENLTLPDL